ncbi:MAG: flagellar hook capping FlgD N-terminal domain-containing protein [Opitutaceae bacterium]
MNAVQSINPSSTDYVAPGSVRTPKQVLGQEDFLKLLTVQFSSQDPLKPMEDTSFIAQMANFSSLEIMNNMSTSMANLSTSQQLSAAQLLLGKDVEVLGKDNNRATGTVSAVFMDGDKTMIRVGNQDYDIASVSRIQMNTTQTQPEI